MTATESSSTTKATIMTTTNVEEEAKTTQKLILIRHARSEGNEFMARPGNEWGDPTFCDDATLLDAKLTETGLKQVEEELLPHFLSSPELLQDVELILVSPLTRTQQTFQYGVLPALKQQREESNDNMPPILAQPLSTERVYTASDTGRDKNELEKEFSWIDWSLLDDTNRIWWYFYKEEDDAHNYQEWRPHGQGQWYAVPGEPQQVFERRMKALEDWIADRDERTILLVVHWAVIGYLTGGYNSANCEVKVLDQWIPLHRQQKADEETE